MNFCWHLFVPSGEDLLQIRGQNGLLQSCVDPLPQVSGKQEVMETAEHVLETFYPVSPTIDLQKVHVYKDELNCTGERPAATLRDGAKDGVKDPPVREEHTAPKFSKVSLLLFVSGFQAS